MNLNATDDTYVVPRLEPLVVPGPQASVGERLDEVAAALGAHVAVRSAQQSYTFAGLLETARAWARGLLAAHPGEPADRPVALDVRSDADSVVALVAVILSGHPAVPLDPMLPDARIAQIVASSGALRIGVDALAGLADAPGIELPAAGIGDPAVIFFTSGSTGAPKGVVHAHAAWLNQAYAHRIVYDLVPEDANLLGWPMSFGGGLDVVFMSLLNGCTLVMHDARMHGMAGLIALLRAAGATTFHASPFLMRSILDALEPDEVLPRLRLTTMGGEPVHGSLVTRMRAQLPPGALYVGVSGASEIASIAFYPLPADRPVPDGNIPVGFPAANKHIEVLGEDGAPLGPGETGMVTVTSRYMSQGYFGQPELTAERFTVNADGTTTYRGGDLGRWDEDGVLHFRGRADVALKINGYLVEPSEVEAALVDLETVTEAVVTPLSSETPDGTTVVRLIAHVVPVVSEKPVTPAALRRVLREKLPSWMVPAEIVLLTALPRNERGKVQREALPPPPPAETVVLPRTPTERLLAGIWSGVLGLERPSVTADLWALGADSLAVAELITAVADETGVTLQSGDLVRAPTIAELALRITGAGEGAEALPPTAVQLRRGTGGPAVFAFAGGGAPALSLLPIAAAVGLDVPIYGFQAAGYETRGRPDWTLRAMVRRHLRTIRRLAPHGPYVLFGHSLGGWLALETASRLRAAGEDVPLVVVLDTIISDVIAPDATTAGSAVAPAASPPPLGRRLAMHARLLGAGWIRYAPGVRDDVFWEQGLRMVKRYRPPDWPGRTIVFTATENTEDPALWGRLLTGDHEIVRLEGGHTSMLRPPFHRPIADRLTDELASLG